MMKLVYVRVSDFAELYIVIKSNEILGYFRGNQIRVLFCNTV